MMSSAAVYVTLLVLSAAATAGLGVYAWQRRHQPGASSLAGMMVAMTIWSAAAAIATVTFDQGTHLFLENVKWFGIVSIPVFWLLFATAYTGYDDLISRRSIAVLSVFPLVTLVLVWTNPSHGLIWTDTQVITAGGIAVPLQQFGPWFWVNILYAYALIGVASFLLLRLAVVSESLYTDQSTLLAIGTVVPLAGNAASVLGVLPLPGFDLTPFAFTVTGLTFGYALFRQQLLDLVPATRRLGRNAAIADLADGVLILDRDHRVVYLNAAAATVLDCERIEPLGEPIDRLVDSGDIDFNAPDGTAELHINDRIHEARTSPIRDRRDHDIGHTLLFHDITERKRRERRLRRQRDTLERLDRLNQLVRDITQAFVNTTSRTAIESVVCDRLSGSGLYIEANIILDPTDEIVAGDGGTDVSTPDTSIVSPVLESDEKPVSSDAETLPEVFDTEHGSWSVVPLGYGRSIYGALVLYTTRSDAFSSRERAVLNQFGDTISQAIDAVENQRLLLADTVTELTFRCPDSVLAAVAEAADCNLSLNGLVPAGEDELLTYCHITDGSTDSVVEAAADIGGITASRVQRDADTVVQFTITEQSPLLAFSTGGTNVRTAETVDEECEVVVEVTPDSDIRALTERVQEHCPAATLIAKHDRDHPVKTSQQNETLSEDTFDGFTERQRDVFEAAYRAGYFESPRDRTAEEIATSINISSPTFHKHLRRAEEQIGEELFDSSDDVGGH